MNATEIKTLRKSLGWTQTKLAEYIGVDQSAVSRWENGKRRPKGLQLQIGISGLIAGYNNHIYMPLEYYISDVVPESEKDFKPSLWSRIKRWLGWR